MSQPDAIPPPSGEQVELRHAEQRAMVVEVGGALRAYAAGDRQLLDGDAIPQENRRRQGLGVEPMTCAPNSFQSGEGLHSLQPGETFTSPWGISPE